MRYKILFSLLAVVCTSHAIKAQDEHRIEGIRFESIDSGQVTADPIRPGGLSECRGRLVYAFDNLQKGFEKTGISTYLALKEINENEDISTVKTRYYTVRKDSQQRRDIKFGVIFDPQFSPNGKYILFKFGTPDIYGSYYLYVLDIASNKAQLVTKRALSYRKTSWSPDSDYIAYVSGGDATGQVTQGERYLGPLRLYACRWKTGEENLAVENDSVRDNFAWGSPHTLIYAALSESEQETLEKQWQTQGVTQSLRNKRKIIGNPQPRIYEYSVEQGKSQILITDGYRPYPSPNSELIAFYGSGNMNKPRSLSRSWMEKPKDADLIISSHKGDVRKRLETGLGSYPYFL